MALQMQEQRRNGVIILAPEGRLDSGKIDQFSKIIQQRIRGGHHRLLIDCTNLVFAASSALRILLQTVRSVREVNGKLVLCNMNPHVRSIFTTAGFHKLMSIRNTFDEGFAEVRPPHARQEPKAEPETSTSKEKIPPTTREDESGTAPGPTREHEPIIKTILLAPFRLVARIGRTIFGY